MVMKIIADSNIPFVEECFSSFGDAKAVPAGEITTDAVRNVDVLLVRSVTKVDEELLKKSSVKFVASATSGFERVDTDFLQSKSVGFAYAPGSNANSVAEYVIAALLAVAKKHKFELQGKSVGIIGAGRIGTKVADKAAALGMKAILNDPPLQR